MLKVRPMDKNEFADFLSHGEPDAMEFFKANVSEGFDNSSVGLALDQMREGMAAGRDRKTVEGLSARTGIPVSGGGADQALKTFTQEEWKQSPYFREGVEFKDGMSEGRAKYLAESFDERELRSLALEKGGEGAGRTVLGFAGQMVGGLPDPINLIPFGSGIKGGSLTAKAVRGMTEGAAGNLAVSSMSRPYWEDRGVESGLQDYANDVLIGGFMGGGFSVAGHGFSKIRERRQTAKLKDRQVVAGAADKAVDAFNAADELNLADSVQSLNQAYDSIYDIEGVKHSDRLVLAEEQLIGMGMEPEVARESLTPMVAHVQMIADATGKSFDEAWEEFGAGFQAAELKGDKITPIAPEARKLESLVDSELSNMMDEIKGAEVNTGLVDTADGGKNRFYDNSFPEWYREAGVKNPEHLAKVMESRKGKIYERLKSIAEDRLQNGYESRVHGRVEPVQEFAQLKQSQLEVPVGPDGEALFQFAGPKAQNAPIERLNEARLLERDGADPEVIRQETGWFKGQDGKWRFEIDDSKARFKEAKISNRGTVHLDKVLDHEALFEAYPQLREIQVSFKTRPARQRKIGTFNLAEKKIELYLDKVSDLSPENKAKLEELRASPEYLKFRQDLEASSSRGAQKVRDAFYATEFGKEYKRWLWIEDLSKTKLPSKPDDSMLDTFLHELQHAIQAEEGFARGGSSKSEGGFEGYRNLHGEIEARDVEARRGFSGEQRRATQPETMKSNQATIKWRGEEIAQNLPPLKERGSAPDAKTQESTPKGADIFDATPQTLLQSQLKKTSGGVERGAIQFRKDGQAIISLFREADKSTILHETGHLFLNNLEKLQDIPAFKKDLSTMRDWLGLKDGEKIGVEHHEKFARGFEQYLREGRAPRRELQGVFERFKDWLTSIYKSARNLNVELSDGAREVYAHLLGGRPDFSPTKAPEAPAPRLTPEQAKVEIQGTDLEAMVQTSPGIATAEEVKSFRNAIAEIEAEEKAIEEALTYMQSGKTAEDLDAALKAAGVSKSKFDEIIEAFNEKLLKEANARMVADDMKLALAAEAKELKRQAHLSLSARTEVMAHTQNILKAGASPRQAVLSLLEGDSSLRGVEGAGKSVDGHYTALAHSTSARCFGELRKIAPNIEKLFENDIQFNQNVLKEMITPGSTGDDMAAQAGKILKDFAEELRERANLAGGKIGKLEGWVPRTHDLDKMIGKRSEWVSFMLENLDPERTFVGMDEARKRDALEEVFASLITDNHGDKMEIPLETPMVRPPRNIAKKMGEHRSLHFKSAEAELQYLKKFGQGDNILQSMSRHLESMSRSIALMERLGPNPESTVAHAIQKLHDDIRTQLKEGKITDVEADKMLAEMGDANALKSRDSDIGHALGMALGESDSAQGMFKTFARTMRAVNSLSKLGSALLSQPTDFVHAVNERRILSGNSAAHAWVDTFKDYFSRATPEMKEVLEHTGIFIDAMNVQNFNRFEADNLNSRLSRWNDKMFRYSGQDWHVRNTKKAAALSLTRELGENIGKSWDEVHPGLREALVQYGAFNEQKWNMLKKVEPAMIDGQAYYHPGLVEKLDDSVFEGMVPEDFKGDRAKEIKRARQKLEMDLKTFFVEEGRNAAPEPDAKIRRIMSFGSKQGTKTYEAIKLLTQFKTFAFVNYDRSIRGKRMMVDPKDYGGLAHHAVSVLALGYLSTVLKDLSKGLEPADPSEGKTWMRAVFQSGGLGIMGDFAQAGISSRSGADALTSLMGPTFSTVSNFVNLSGKTVRGDALEDPSKLTSDWVNFGRSLAPAPFSSLWYTRAAMDLVIWSQLKETLEPGSIRRSERRLKKEYNQEYLISPRAIGR